jgi:D-3-phosphoglycerate dehydrogenase
MLEAAGIEVKGNPFGRRLTEEEIIEHLKDVDGLIAGLEPLNRNVLSSAAPRLKALARVGIGVVNVDFDAAKEFGVKVSNTPEGPVAAVAEMTLTALLAIGRKLFSMNAALHAGEWTKSIGFGLVGTKVLIVGYGRIGRRVGELLRAFGAVVLVHDPYINDDSLLHGERLVSLNEGLAEAAVVSLHASGEDCLLNSDSFENMQDGVVLLNAARGGLVNEDALIAALESGKVSGTWFDAFWQEPYSGRLQEFEQALLTPHVGTYTEQCRRGMETTAVQNLLRDLGL